MKQSIVVAALGVCLAGCSSGPSAPTALAESYSAVTVNGAALPLHGFSSVSNAAGSCVVDMLSSDLMLVPEGTYDMYVYTSRTCTGETQPVNSLVRSHGNYSRHGEMLVFVPTVYPAYSIESGRVDDGEVLLEMSRTNGDHFALRFVPSNGNARSLN